MADNKFKFRFKLTVAPLQPKASSSANDVHNIWIHHVAVDPRQMSHRCVFVLLQQLRGGNLHDVDKVESFIHLFAELFNLEPCVVSVLRDLVQHVLLQLLRKRPPTRSCRTLSGCHHRNGTLLPCEINTSDNLPAFLSHRKHSTTYIYVDTVAYTDTNTCIRYKYKQSTVLCLLCFKVPDVSAENVTDQRTCSAVGAMKLRQREASDVKIRPRSRVIYIHIIYIYIYI